MPKVAVTVEALIQVHVAAVLPVKLNNMVHGQVDCLIPAWSVGMLNIIETNAPLAAKTTDCSCGAINGLLALTILIMVVLFAY